MTGRDDGYVPISRENLDAMLQLIDDGHGERMREAGRREGQAAKTGDGYRTGYDLGHDTGLSARQDTRAYVHGILDGWAAGCQERHELVEQLTRQAAPRPRRLAERQAEAEAGA